MDLPPNPYSRVRQRINRKIKKYYAKLGNGHGHPYYNYHYLPVHALQPVYGPPYVRLLPPYMPPYPPCMPPYPQFMPHFPPYMLHPQFVPIYPQFISHRQPFMPQHQHIRRQHPKTRLPNENAENNNLSSVSTNILNTSSTSSTGVDIKEEIVDLTENSAVNDAFNDLLIKKEREIQENDKEIRSLKRLLALEKLI